MLELSKSDPREAVVDRKSISQCRDFSELWKNRHLKTWLILFYGARCEFCGRQRALTFAHNSSTPIIDYYRKLGIGRAHKGRKRGGARKKLNDVIKHPGCYYLLCWRCHVKYDNGWRPPDLCDGD